MTDTAGEDGPGDRRREGERDRAEREAAAGPSAARWLLADPDADRDAGPAVGVPVDVVQDLLALDPRTSLRSRGEEKLRALAGKVERLVGAGAVAPSGRPLLEVLVAASDERAALAPSFDIGDLLSDEPVRDASYDRTVRLAEAMLERARAHRDGDIDLYAQVAPPGLERHERAEDIEATVRVATEQLDCPASSEPAIVTTDDGWIAASPAELFLTAACGVLQAAVQDVVGAALYTWLEEVAERPEDPWWTGLSARLPVDAPSLLQQAAARSGSDHPEVAGAALVAFIAVRYPMDPG